MSSATSIKNRAALAADESSIGSALPDAGFRPWHFFILASLIAATAAVIISRRSSPEHLVLISLTIAGAGAAAIGLYRMLAPLVSSAAATSAEPLSTRARTVLEREKALTLRSIKELEFDRAMGKLSDRDFEEMSGRLRARAIALMKELEKAEEERSGYRALIEHELSARLATRRRRETTDASSVRAQPHTPPTCASCGSPNDLDAAFCKRCGTRLADSGSVPRGSSA